MPIEALIRNGSRTNGKLQPIGVDEALRTATMWLSPLVHQGPGGINLCVGYDFDFQLAADWMAQADSNGLFVDRALSAANAPKARSANEKTSLVLAFGSGTGRGAARTQAKLADFKKLGAKIISLNPTKTGLSSLADIWLPIRPGADEIILQVILGQLPCSDKSLAGTDLSVAAVENLVKELEANRGRVSVLAGRGVFAHVNASHSCKLLEELGADILPAADHANALRHPSSLLDRDCEAVLCAGSALVWQSQTITALQNFDGRIICLSEQPAGFETCADLVFRGQAEENFLALAARLGLNGFSDAAGNSPFAAGYQDYQPMGAKISPLTLSLQPRRQLEKDSDFPFHAISQKAHDGANRAVVFMNTKKARSMGLENKDIVQIKSSCGAEKAVLALMDEMNENTVWSWGGTLFNKLLPQDEPLRDATTGQPAWFDLKVAVEKVAPTS